MTNAEYIRRMTNEQLAEIIIKSGYKCECCAYDDYECKDDCQYGVQEWLKKEREC